MRPGTLARAGGGFGPQAFDLAPWQGDADLSDPFQLHPDDRLGVEAREVDQSGGFSPLDGFQITLAGLQPDRGLFAVEAGNGVAQLVVDHNNVAVFVFRQHGIAGDLKGDGFFSDRERQFDGAETFRRHLLVLRFDAGAGADAAHHRHRIQFEIIDDGLDFRRLDQAGVGQYFGHRARANAHRGRETPLGLARLLQPPLDHPDIQHGASFPNFRNDSNSDYPKSSLTLISEYQKLMAWPWLLAMTRRITEELNAIDQLDAATFRGAAGISRARHVLFGNRRRDQRKIQDRLFA